MGGTARFLCHPQTNVDHLRLDQLRHPWARSLGKFVANSLFRDQKKHTMPNREVQVGNSIEHCREPLATDPGKAMFIQRLKNAVRFRLLRWARKREQRRFRDYCLSL